MRSFRNTLPFTVESHPSNSRKAGRLSSHGIATSLGEIADYSATGMRLRMSGKLTIAEDSIVIITIEGPEGPIIVAARVVWIRKRGWRKHDAGVHFENVTPETRKQLAAIARAPHVGVMVTGDRARQG